MRIGARYRNREEACLSGGTGCGVLYLTGCTMRCVTCLVPEISRNRVGEDLSPALAARMLLRMASEGVSHIEIANAESFPEEVRETVSRAREAGLRIPLVNNFSGYADAAVLRFLLPSFDIYLMDLKYRDNALALRLSGVPDYAERSAEALRTLTACYGPDRYAPDGLLTRGVVLRHLMLPGLPENTDAVLRFLRTENPARYPLSLMDDFVPEHRTAEFLTPPYEISPRLAEEKRALARAYGIPLLPRF